MTGKRVVFVLGAGVGQDIRMPLGNQLARSIRKRVRYDIVQGEAYSGGDIVLRQAFERATRPRRLKKSSFGRACYLLERGLAHASSIDDFLFAHADDRELQMIGKLAIVRSILEAERDSSLNLEHPRSRDRITSSEVEKSWLMQFFGLLRGRLRRGEEKKLFEAVSIISFNYDRCIEHFLYHSVQEYFGVSADVAAAAVAKLDIYHPYGIIGNLPWQSRQNVAAFGTEPTAASSLELSNQLRTYNEEISDTAILGNLRLAISSAETAIFLGFHFHRQNIELLAPQSHASRVYATVFGRSDNDQRVIRDKLTTFVGKDLPAESTSIILADCNCSELFTRYALEWAA